jgi:hypothetical protein
MTYEFLSPEWISAAQAIREELGATTSAPVALTMNLTVNEVPFGDSPLLVALDTSHGILALQYGRLDRADITISVDWLTAKSILIDGKPQAAMTAFMAGKVKIEGDMSKLVALQSAGPDSDSEGVVDRLRAITT